MKRRAQRLVVTASALSMLVAVHGCSSPPTVGGASTDGNRDSDAQSVFAKFADMTGDERHNALVEAAKAEGELVMFAGGDTSEKVVPAFEQKYGIETEAISPASNTQLRKRLQQEQQAGKMTADLLEIQGEDMNYFAEQGLFHPYDSSIADEMPPSPTKDKSWTRTRYANFMIAWNTELVPPEQAPKSLEELADPKWAGKVTLVNDSPVWYAATYRYYNEKGMTDQAFGDMMRAIAANASARDGNSSSTSLMAGGSFDVLVQTGQFDVKQFAEKGAPISARPLAAPIVAIPVGMGILKGADHPASAVLFMDFYLTEGQKILASAYRQPANFNAAGDLPWSIMGEPFTVEADVAELGEAERINAWRTAYNNLVQGRNDVLPPQPGR